MLRLTKLMIILTAGLFAGGAMAQNWPDAGVWTYRTTTDEFTDEVSHYLWLVAEKLSTNGQTIAMQISCVDNETGIYIRTGTFTLEGYSNPWDVAYRIDDMEINKFQVLSRHDGFIPQLETENIPLIKSMFSHNKLRMRFENRNQQETVTFKITNIETEIKPIREACNW